MMLHIGCGNSRIEEFVNIDCKETLTTDLVAQAWELPVPDGEVEYIYARHMFEHLSRREANKALLEWRRVLSVGGLLHLVVPNLLFHAKQLLGLAESPRPSQWKHAIAGFYGWQNDDDTDVHRWGYTPETLRGLLRSFGFQETEDGFPELTERDSEDWHINIRGVRV